MSDGGEMNDPCPAQANVGGTLYDCDQQHDATRRAVVHVSEAGRVAWGEGYHPASTLRAYIAALPAETREGREALAQQIEALRRKDLLGPTESTLRYNEALRDAAALVRASSRDTTEPYGAPLWQ